MDSIRDGELKRKAVVDRVYRAFLKEADSLPEDQFRMLAHECMTRLFQGLECSLRSQLTGDALMAELGFARCAHCEALLAAAEVDGHQCKPEDLARLTHQLIQRPGFLG